MARPNILIVDYGMGNIRSIQNALTRLGCMVSTSHRAEDILAADALILPGVGAFGEAVAKLGERKLAAPILDAVNNEGKPLLGICLGMQLLADSSEERGFFKGLSLIPGEVRGIPVPADLRLPHIGWNAVTIHRKQPLFADLQDGDAFYFVHSYHFACNAEYVAATTDYGGDIAAAVQRGRVFGVQFHPERSQSKGLTLLGNFVAFVNSVCGEESAC